MELAPWEIEAAILPEAWGLTDTQRRDYVIERWLIVGGDTRPFLDWVLRAGHSPSRRVIEIVAQMMAKSVDVELPDNMMPPFGLTVDRTGHAHAPKNMGAEVAGYCYGAISSSKIDGGVPPKLADHDTWQFARGLGFKAGLDTVEAKRKAYRKSRGKRLRRPKGTN